MSDPHRDELAAAYERIAALEAKIDELTAPAPAPENERVAELARRLAALKARPPSWEPAVLASPVAFLLIVFAVALAQSGPNPPMSLVAFLSLVAVVAFVLFHRFVKRTMLRGYKRTVADAQQALDEARVRVRIDVPQEAQAAETEEERESEARAQRRG